MKEPFEIETHITLLKSELPIDVWDDYCAALTVDPDTTKVIKVFTDKNIPYNSLEEYERDA